jgi:hypothetical protein
MQEKPVRKTSWMGVVSLCLGLLGFVPSFGIQCILVTLMPVLDELLIGRFLFHWGTWVSSSLGVIGLIVGIIGLARAGDQKRSAVWGIIFSALSILFGVPAALLWFGFNATF